MKKIDALKPYQLKFKVGDKVKYNLSEIVMTANTTNMCEQCSENKEDDFDLDLIEIIENLLVFTIKSGDINRSRLGYSYIIYELEPISKGLIDEPIYANEDDLIAIK